MRRALPALFRWTAAEFEERMRGSAIYRIGYERWSRNIAVALGNAPTSAAVIEALAARRRCPLSWCASTSSGRSRGTRGPAERCTDSGPGGAHVVDQPRPAQARRGQHHQFARLRAPGLLRSSARRTEK